ncbi:MAG: DUF4384 domain-containing protein [Gammaproteobacteria bacterium]|nr:DUF4384 domain-containing protein [Gammaproteobacteria bacterium]
MLKIILGTLIGGTILLGVEYGIFNKEGSALPQIGKFIQTAFNDQKTRSPEEITGNVQKTAKAADDNTLGMDINYIYRSGGKGEWKKLRNGGVLESGDHYKIIFTPEQNGYVYIFQTDSSEHIYRLFPMAAFKGVTVNNFNPAEAGKTYYIPAEDKSFKLDTQTGTESLYFIAMRNPEPLLARQYENVIMAKRRKDQGALLMASAEILKTVKTRGLASIEQDPEETQTHDFTEDGQTSSPLRMHLEGLCDGCGHVLTFQHR